MLNLNSSPSSSNVRNLESELQREHDACLAMQEHFWHQRARVKLALFGNSNTRYFHALAVTRHRNNQIRAIMGGDGGWETYQKGIRSLFVDHFRIIYAGSPCAELQSVYPPQILQALPKLPNLILDHLEALPSPDEIQRALNSLGPNKSPGPDGFNAKIIQENWDLFGPAVIEEVDRFFKENRMPGYVARSNLNLIPKTENASKVTEFRPISVCNVLYKVNSKLIAKRIRPFISSLISNCQSAFVPGRDISENVILLREVLHSFKSNDYKNSEFCLKVDLSKAFDRMNWDYLESLLPLYDFPTRLVSWIMTCVRSAEFLVVVNGRGDGFLKLNRGCGKDALSPHISLFLVWTYSQGLCNTKSAPGN